MNRTRGPGDLFPAKPGIYVLVLHLPAPARIVVGRLGDFNFAQGWHAYVGSACGSGGLRGRLRHHLAPVCSPHWHIDYLRQAAVVEQVWYAVGESRQEHQWAAALATLPGAQIQAPRFGASDCRCPSHLIHSPGGWDFDAFCEFSGPTLERLITERLRGEAVKG